MIAQGIPQTLMSGRTNTVSDAVISLPTAALEVLKPIPHADYVAFLHGLRLITGNSYLHRAREAKKRFAELTLGKSVEGHTIGTGPRDNRALTVAAKMFTDDGGNLRYIDEISTILGGHFLVQTHGYTANLEGFTLDEPRGPESIELFLLTAKDKSYETDVWLNFTGEPTEAQTIFDIHILFAHKTMEHGVLKTIHWLSNESIWGEFVRVTSA